MQTKPLFEVNEVDRQFYVRLLRDYGPEGAFGGDSRILRGAGWR